MQSRERRLQEQELSRLREELSRAHRELREATREMARAHSELARAGEADQLIKHVNLGDRAVIGVILGQESADGVQVIGVSPDGPAERAGVQAGDLLVSIRGESLAGGHHRGRDTLHRVLEEAGENEALALVVSRDGETWNLTVTPERREPSSWQTLIRIPEAPAAPHAPDAPHIVVERIEIPDIDTAEIERRVAEASEKLKAMRYEFVMPDGQTLEGDIESFGDIEFEDYSGLAERALREANVWFGLPQAQGLELASIDEGLGSYFDTNRGVLVLRARENNAYQLRSGDVVLDVNGQSVNAPSDLVRALREIEPGSAVDLTIKRDRRDRTLSVTMPENRLGYTDSHLPQFAHPAH
jgi:predicted metalloprotease with PDZ domain